jgi:hypothetical protein
MPFGIPLPFWTSRRSCTSGFLEPLGSLELGNGGSWGCATEGFLYSLLLPAPVSSGAPCVLCWLVLGSRVGSGSVLLCSGSGLCSGGCARLAGLVVAQAPVLRGLCWLSYSWGCAGAVLLGACAQAGSPQLRGSGLGSGFENLLNPSPRGGTRFVSVRAQAERGWGSSGRVGPGSLGLRHGLPSERKVAGGRSDALHAKTCTPLKNCVGSINELRKARLEAIQTRKMPEYIVESPTGVELHTSRPKQTDFKAAGEGTYTLRRMDGKVSRIQTVSTNRNGNLKVTVTSPSELQSLSAPQLNRVIRNLSAIVKLTPVLVTPVLKKAEAERDHRIAITMEASEA